MTITNGIPPGGGGPSGTSYVGSYQHVLANEATHADALRRLQREAAGAADDAFGQGQREGYASGHAAGRAEAINEANARLHQQLAFTRAHVADKERLKAALAEQAKLINALEARVKELEAENAVLRESEGILLEADASLRDIIGSLRSANDKLQEQVTQLDADYKKRSQELADQIWQYNRAMIYVSTVGGVLEELTRDNTPQAQQARELFVQKYAKEVNKGLESNTIKMAPHLDPDFDRYLPKTRRFIADLLDKAQNDKTDTPTPGM